MPHEMFLMMHSSTALDSMHIISWLIGEICFSFSMVSTMCLISISNVMKLRDWYNCVSVMGPSTDGGVTLKNDVSGLIFSVLGPTSTVAWHQCRTKTKLKQKVDEVFKSFRHDPTFLRTEEQLNGSWANVRSNSNSIQLPFNNLLNFCSTFDKVADLFNCTRYSFSKFVEWKVRQKPKPIRWAFYGHRVSKENYKQQSQDKNALYHCSPINFLR